MTPRVLPGLAFDALTTARPAALAAVVLAGSVLTGLAATAYVVVLVALAEDVELSDVEDGLPSLVDLWRGAA